MSDSRANSHQAIPSAQIIIFPTRSGSVECNAGETPSQRLARALVILDEALAAQREALANWREAIADLGGSVNALGHSMRAYHAVLSGLNGKLAGSPDA